MVTWTFDVWTYDEERRLLSRAVQETLLRAKTAALLRLFLRNPNQILEKEMIMENVWKDRIVTDNTLMQSIRELRSLLSDDAQSPIFIQTVHGRGYRWVGPNPEEQDGLSENQQSPKIATWLGQKWGFVAVAAVFLIVVALSLLPIRQTTAFHDLERGHQAYQQGDLRTAETVFTRSLRKNANNQDALLGMALAYFDRGNRQAAEEFLENSVSNPGAPSELSRVIAPMLSGAIARDKGDLAAADRYFQDALRYVDTPSTEFLRAQLMVRRSNNAADLGRINDYVRLRMENSSSALISESIEAKIESLVGSGTMVMGGLDESWGLPELHTALAMYEKLGVPRGIADVALALGDESALPFAEREQHLKRAIAIYDENDIRRGRVLGLVLYTDLAIQFLDAPKAQLTAEKCLELATQIGSNMLQADCRYRLGLAHMISASSLDAADPAATQMAKQQFEQALDQYQRMGAVLNERAVRLHLAIVALDQGEAETALDAFQSLDELYRQMPYPAGAVGARLGSAAALHALGRLNDADAVLDDLGHEATDALALVDDLRATLFSQPADGSNAKKLFRTLVTAERVLSSQEGVAG